MIDERTFLDNFSVRTRTNVLAINPTITVTIEQKIEKAALRKSKARDVLNRAKVEYDRAERDFNELLGCFADSQAPVARRKTSKAQDQPAEIPETNGSTNIEKLEAVFKANPGKTLTYADLEEHFPQMARNSLRPLIFGLKKTGKIISEGYGRFKVAD